MPPPLPLLRRASALLGVGMSVWALAVACSSTEPGLSVSVALSPARFPTPEADGTRVFHTDLGYEVKLLAGFVVIEHLEIYRCDGMALAPGASGTSRALASLERLGAWFAPKPAHAHTHGNARRLAAPVVVDLLSPHGPAWQLGQLALRPAAYCSFQHSLGPADDDAERLTSPEQVGQSVWLSLEVVGGELPEPLPLELRSEEPFDGFYELHTLELGEELRHAMVHVTHQGDTWFDAIDFTTATPDRVLQRFLRNFRDSVEVMWH